MKSRTMPTPTNNQAVALDALGRLARADAAPAEPVRFTDSYGSRVELDRSIVFRVRCYEDGRVEAHSATRAKWDRGLNPDPAQYVEGDWVSVGYSPKGTG